MAAVTDQIGLKLVGECRIEKKELSATVYKGTQLEVGGAAGRVRHLAGNNTFAGFAMESGESGDWIEVAVEGTVESAINVTVAGGDEGNKVYGITNNPDDNNNTSSSRTLLGRVSTVITAGAPSVPNVIQWSFAATGNQIET